MPHPSHKLLLRTNYQELPTPFKVVFSGWQLATLACHAVHKSVKRKGAWYIQQSILTLVSGKAGTILLAN